MLKLFGKKDRKLVVDLSLLEDLKKDDKILIVRNGELKLLDISLMINEIESGE